MHVLVVHNRYRIEGGEERSVELQLAALRRAGVAHALLERRSAELSRSQAALALHQPRVFDSVDRFVVPGSYAAAQSALLGVPSERIDVLPHYLPAEAF